MSGQRGVSSRTIRAHFTAGDTFHRRDNHHYRWGICFCDRRLSCNYRVYKQEKGRRRRVGLKLVGGWAKNVIFLHAPPTFCCHLIIHEDRTTASIVHARSSTAPDASQTPCCIHAAKAKRAQRFKLPFPHTFIPSLVKPDNDHTRHLNETNKPANRPISPDIRLQVTFGSSCSKYWVSISMAGGR